MINEIKKVSERILRGGDILVDEAERFIAIDALADFECLKQEAHRIYQHFGDNKANLCALVNAKSGACSEDCKFCAQSGHYTVNINEYPLLDCAQIVAKAKQAEAHGAHRFCIVTSGGALDATDFQRVIAAYCAIREHTSLALDGSLGILSNQQLVALKKVGVTRINHNLETSQRFFASICSTHTFQERYETIKRVKAHGLQVCSGGIIGMGESAEDRVSMAYSLKMLEVTCVPINILNPRPGTPFEHQKKLSVQEIITTIAVIRFILPTVTIKIAGGREVNLGDAQVEALRAGANGIIIDGYLTTTGNTVHEDLELIRQAGFEY